MGMLGGRLGGCEKWEEGLVAPRSFGDHRREQLLAIGPEGEVLGTRGRKGNKGCRDGLPGSSDTV